MNRILYSLILVCIIVSGLSAQSDSLDRFNFKPNISVGMSFRLPQTKSFDIAYRPFRFCELKATVVIGNHELQNKFGLDKFNAQGRSTGIGISIFETYLSHKKPIKFGVRWGVIGSFIVGKGSTNISGEVLYSGKVHNDRTESYQLNDVKYWFFDYKLGCELIIKKYLRVELYPIQIGWFDSFPKREYPLKYLPPIGYNNGRGRLSSGAGLHWQFELSKKKR